MKTYDELVNEAQDKHGRAMQKAESDFAAAKTQAKKSYDESLEAALKLKKEGKA